MASPKHDIRLGTTIYSLTNEYHSRRYSFEALVQKVAELGIGRSPAELHVLGGHAQAQG